MDKFIEIPGGDGTWHFINASQITKVSCEVFRMKLGGELGSLNLVHPNRPVPSRVQFNVTVTIRLFTANGTGDVKFNSEREADIWAHAELGIDEIVSRSQTSLRRDQIP